MTQIGVRRFVWMSIPEFLILGTIIAGSGVYAGIKLAPKFSGKKSKISIVRKNGKIEKVVLDLGESDGK